jgi:hypothetical protein
MKYLLLIYTDETNDPRPGTPDFEKRSQDYAVFTNDVLSSGKFSSGEGLLPIATAKTVRVRGGKPFTTDGPFAETKEQLGGFYVLDVANIDEALDYPSKIPAAVSGSIEVRPVIPARS